MHTNSRYASDRVHQFGKVARRGTFVGMGCKKCEADAIVLWEAAGCELGAQLAESLPPPLSVFFAMRPMHSRSLSTGISNILSHGLPMAMHERLTLCR